MDEKLKIDASFLESVGLGGLPVAEANLLLKHAYATLEQRVGFALAQQMTDVQLEEFEVFFDEGDDAGAFAWLERELPDYKSVVHQEFELLTLEFRKSAVLMLALIGEGE